MDSHTTVIIPFDHRVTFVSLLNCMGVVGTIIVILVIVWLVRRA